MAKVRRTALTTRIVWVIVLVFMLAMIVSQMVIHFYNPLVTENAELYSSTSFTELTGVYFRDETVINYNGSGVVSYVYGDGERLAKNSEIARIYKNSNDLALQHRIDELEEQIRILNDAQSLVGTDNSQLETFSNQIYENQSSILTAVSGASVADISELKNNYLNLSCKKQIVKGTATDYSEKIKELEGQITVLKGQISAEPQMLVIDSSGYFAGTVDGYEGKLTISEAQNVTEDVINSVIENPSVNTDSSAIGKIVAGYKWKLACVIRSEDAKGVFESAVLDIRIGSQQATVKATVETMTRSEATGNVVMVLSFDNLNAELLSGRTVRFRIIRDDYQGIRIPKSAIRFDEEGNEGVYIKYGVEILFRKINVITYGDDYAICEDTSEQNGYLSLYDMVVVEGTDLYDGKIITE